MKLGDLQKVLAEFGQTYMEYQELGPQARDKETVELHAQRRRELWDTMKFLEKKIWYELDTLNEIRKLL